MLAAATGDAAKKLLKPYLANFEANGRLKAFYGDQVNLGDWTDEHFVLKNGASFTAVGAGQAPRGSRNENVRPDILLTDDYDTDQDCRNPSVLDKKWDWWEKAYYPTRSVSEPTLVLWAGNIIAKDTCVGRAGKMADHWDIINLTDKDGNSTWPQKNTTEKIERIRSSVSKKTYEGEYNNNPICEGKVFTNLPFGKVPSLKKFKFIVIYGDPSYSNKRTRATHTRQYGPSDNTRGHTTSSTASAPVRRTPITSIGTTRYLKGSGCRRPSIASRRTTAFRTRSSSRS